MVVVLLLMWKPHQMKMTNHHKRKVERMSLDEVDKVAYVAEVVNVVEAVEVANVEEVANVTKEAEVASVEEAANVANNKVLEKVMNCSGCMERYNILLKGKQLLATFLLLALHVALLYALNRLQHLKIFAAQKSTDFEFCYEELLAFIGITIAMGLLKLPQIRDYWSKHEILATPWFPAIMSRDRYFQILQYLHLVDSSQQKKRG